MKLGGDETVVIKSTIFEDNNGAINTANAVNMIPSTKHISVKCHLFKNYYGEGSGITLVKVVNILKKADISTKGMVLEKLITMQKLLCEW